MSSIPHFVKIRLEDFFLSFNSMVTAMSLPCSTLYDALINLAISLLMYVIMHLTINFS